MDGATFIYRNRPDAGFFDASSREMRGGPDKVIVYINGVLCAMDREAKITIPVSRWKLAEIGLACFLAALKGKGATARPPEVEPVPLPEPSAKALPEPLPEAAADPESPEDQWERLLKELRDLSR